MKEFITTAPTTVTGALAASAAPTQEEAERAYRRINGRLSLDNYTDLKRGASIAGVSASAFLDYAFGVYVKEHPDVFTDPEAARAVGREIYGRQ